MTDRGDDSTLGLLVAFTRHLRLAGLAVPVSNVVCYTRAVAAVGIDRRDRLYWAGRAVLVHRQEDVATYDQVFGSFWSGTPGGPDAPGLQSDRPCEEFGDGAAPLEGASPDPSREPSERSCEEIGNRGAAPLEGAPPSRLASVSYSDADQLRHKDFANCTSEELDEVSRLLRETCIRAVQRSRRTRRSTRDRGRHDPRATMRRAMRSGGEVVRLMRREPGSRPRRVVLLCDVSGSMEPYARVLLRFLHVSVAGRREVEAFAVGTRLTRLTRQLTSRDPDIALRHASAAVVDWSGGTRLGEGIGNFNERFGMPGMARGAIVVILSDGLDRGDPALLSTEMTRLHRAAHQTIWVNPLKASAGYEPLARGMAAALPHVDRFVEGHSAASLDVLVDLIGGSEW